MNLLNKIILCLTLMLMTLSLTNLSRADAHSDRLDNIESQVQDALIKIKGMEKKTKDVPTIKVGPGLKIKSGKNEVKFGGRIHFDVGLHDADTLLTCEAANDSAGGGNCVADGTNFRRLRLAMSGKYADGFYYKASVDWGASAKTIDDNEDQTSVDEVYMGYKLGKSTTISLGKQKIPLSFAESTSSNDLPFIERAPAVDIMTDSSIGPKQMSVQLRHWDKTANYLIETALHGGTDLADTDDYDERFGYTGRVVYAPSLSKSQVLHLGAWYDYTDTDRLDVDPEWSYRIGLNVFDEKPLDADVGDDLGDITGMEHYGGEIALLYDNFWAAGEWIWGAMERDGAGKFGANAGDNCSSVETDMGYYELGATINGKRRYTIKKGGWKRPKVKDPVNKGGAGVHEIGYRFNNSSLSTMCNGYDSQGQMHTHTFGYNWQLTNNNRIMFNYILATIDSDGIGELSGYTIGESFNGVTLQDTTTQDIKALGIRFQTNW